MNRNNVHNKQIISVPVKQQKEFSAFVKQVDKLKVVVILTENIAGLTIKYD